MSSHVIIHNIISNTFGPREFCVFYYYGRYLRVVIVVQKGAPRRSKRRTLPNTHHLHTIYTETLAPSTTIKHTIIRGARSPKTPNAATTHLSTSRSAKFWVLIWERALWSCQTSKSYCQTTMWPSLYILPLTWCPLHPIWPLFNNNPCQRFLAKIIRTPTSLLAHYIHHFSGRPGPGQSTCTFLNGNLGYSGQQRPMPNIHKVCLE